jgi:hypothetical protein
MAREARSQHWHYFLCLLIAHGRSCGRGRLKQEAEGLRAEAAWPLSGGSGFGATSSGRCGPPSPVWV